MDGPGDGCRDIQSSDKDNAAVLIQCKCFEDPKKTVGSSDVNELVVALTKFGKKRGIIATTGKISPQLKREFTDNFPNLNLDWMDGSDIVDEVFSNPVLFRAWVSGNTVGHETIFIKIPFIIRRAVYDSPLELSNQTLRGGFTIDGRDSIDISSLEFFRPPEAVHWSELFGRHVRCAAVLSTSPPDLHDLESIHMQVLEELFSDKTDVLIVRFGIPYLVPTKDPQFDNGIGIPGFSPRSYIVRPNKPITPEQDFLLLKSSDWIWPEYLSMAEGDWGNWQTSDNQRWCHIEINGPSFPNSPQAHICRMIGESKRTDLINSQALFITATRDICDRLLASIPVEPDIHCANGPGGRLIGWIFSNKSNRTEQREMILAKVSEENLVEILDVDDAIRISLHSDNPLVPSPGREVYYPAQLFWKYNELPSPHFLKGRTCAFIEFWKLPVDLESALADIEKLKFQIADGWRVFVDCKWGYKTKKVFLMLSVSVPWPLEKSSTEVVLETKVEVDNVFIMLAKKIQKVWPDASCSTSEFWEEEVRLPAGLYLPTAKGLVRSNWWPEEEEKGDE
jgi:hypothetical protein